MQREEISIYLYLTRTFFYKYYKSKHLKGRLVPRVRQVFESKTILVIRCTMHFWIYINPGYSMHPFRHVFGSTTMFSWKVWSALLLDQVPSELTAEHRRREVRNEIFTAQELVTARRSILGPPAEGRSGPGITSKQKGSEKKSIDVSIFDQNFLYKYCKYYKKIWTNIDIISFDQNFLFFKKYYYFF